MAASARIRGWEEFFAVSIIAQAIFSERSCERELFSWGESFLKRELTLLKSFVARKYLSLREKRSAREGSSCSIVSKISRASLMSCKERARSNRSKFDWELKRKQFASNKLAKKIRKRPSSEKMEMNVKDRLSGRRTAIAYNAEVVKNTFLCCYLFCNKQHLSQP
jgi:hypothetical protein